MNTFFARKFTRESVFLLGICLLFFLLRFPSLYEPYWYGDEGIYFIIGKALHAGRILYVDIWDNKPPLLYWFYFMFNDLFSIRFVSLIFGLSSVITFFFLAGEFLRKQYAQYLSTSIFAVLLALPTIEGNIANAENFMLFPILLGALFFWKATQKIAEEKTLQVAQLQATRKMLYISGATIGIAFLFKTVAVFDFAAFLLYLIFISIDRNVALLKLFLHLKKKYLLFIVGFFTPFLFVSVFFLLQGVLPEFLTTIFLKNVSYVGENNVFFIPQGLLLLKMLFLIVSLFVLFRLHTKLDHKIIFILVWLAFSLFNAFFSQRPYIHYQLVMLPSLILLFGMIPQLPKSKQRIFITITACVCVYILYTMFPHWNMKKTIAYYQNFSSYIMGNRSLTDYQTFFDWNTPRDYALADYLSLHTKKNEALFIWGNSAQVYYLSDTLPAGRYAVSYHIMTPESIKQTLDALQKSQPNFFVLLPGTEPLPFTIPDYVYKLTINDAVIYEKSN